MGRVRELLTGRAAPALVACALLLRLLVPAGWMPAIGADGFARITLCTGEGRVQAWIDADGVIHDQAPAGTDAHDQPCAFSGLALALTQLDPPEPAGPSAIASAVAIVFPAAVAIGLGLAAPPPPATGPPPFL